jgi:hypothetical protein
MSDRRCLRCCSESIVDGALYSPMRLSFRPDSSKFLTLETGDIMTKAVMCRDCGNIDITGDVNKLQRLTTHSKKEASADASPTV